MERVDLLGRRRDVLLHEQRFSDGERQGNLQTSTTTKKKRKDGLVGIPCHKYYGNPFGTYLIKVQPRKVVSGASFTNRLCGESAQQQHTTIIVACCARGRDLRATQCGYLPYFSQQPILSYTNVSRNITNVCTLILYLNASNISTQKSGRT